MTIDPAIGYLSLVMGGAVACLIVIGIFVVARIIEALGDEDYHR